MIKSTDIAERKFNVLPVDAKDTRDDLGFVVGF